MFGDPPRTLGRAPWKVLYRLERITRRECGKAWTNSLLYGSGFITAHPLTNEPMHVSALDVLMIPDVRDVR